MAESKYNEVSESLKQMQDAAAVAEHEARAAFVTAYATFEVALSAPPGHAEAFAEKKAKLIQAKHDAERLEALQQEAKDSFEEQMNEAMAVLQGKESRKRTIEEPVETGTPAPKRPAICDATTTPPSTSAEAPIGPSTTASTSMVTVSAAITPPMGPKHPAKARKHIREPTAGARGGLKGSVAVTVDLADEAQQQAQQQRLKEATLHKDKGPSERYRWMLVSQGVMDGDDKGGTAFKKPRRLQNIIEAGINAGDLTEELLRGQPYIFQRVIGGLTKAKDAKAKNEHRGALIDYLSRDASGVLDEDKYKELESLVPKFPKFVDSSAAAGSSGTVATHPSTPAAATPEVQVGQVNVAEI